MYRDVRQIPVPSRLDSPWASCLSWREYYKYNSFIQIIDKYIYIYYLEGQYTGLISVISSRKWLFLRLPSPYQGKAWCSDNTVITYLITSW